MRKTLSVLAAVGLIAAFAGPAFAQAKPTDKEIADACKGKAAGTKVKLGAAEVTCK